MSKGKIYISGPVTGTDDYEARFLDAQLRLNAEGWTAYNPVPALAAMPETTTHGEYMVVAIAMLSLCDTIFLMNGWEKSEGCRMEWAWASQHGLNVIEP